MGYFSIGMRDRFGAILVTYSKIPCAIPSKLDYTGRKGKKTLADTLTQKEYLTIIYLRHACYYITSGICDVSVNL